MKCSSCGINYGIKEPIGLACKGCEEKLNLVEFWDPEEIKEDLDFAFSQPFNLVLVADRRGSLLGFTWGYKLALDKFPFLSGSVCENANYMDEIAVRGNERGKGIGTFLGRKYFEESRKNGVREVVLRTDETNSASMNLFQKLGFIDLKVRDPEFERRIYLAKDLGEENE